MKREKEKIVALNNYIHETSSSGCEAVKENAFIAGFEIADRTMLDRACEWMSKVFFQNPFLTKKGIVSGKYDTMEEFITAFRQAMEGSAE